jgi:hypothetical protein
MTDLKNGHLQASIVYKIDDSEVALTDSIPIIVPGKFFRAVRTRIFAQGVDPFYHSAPIGLGAYRLNFFCSRGLEQKLIFCHGA